MNHSSNAMPHSSFDQCQRGISLRMNWRTRRRAQIWSWPTGQQQPVLLVAMMLLLISWVNKDLKIRTREQIITSSFSSLHCIKALITQDSGLSDQCLFSSIPTWPSLTKKMRQGWVAVMVMCSFYLSLWEWYLSLSKRQSNLTLTYFYSTTFSHGAPIKIWDPSVK